jgi:hypothetical protein
MESRLQPVCPVPVPLASPSTDSKNYATTHRGTGFQPVAAVLRGISVDGNVRRRGTHNSSAGGRGRVEVGADDPARKPADHRCPRRAIAGMAQSGTIPRVILRLIRSCLRRVLNLSFLAALSLLLCIGLGCVWERSLSVSEELKYVRSSGQEVRLETIPRGLVF